VGDFAAHPKPIVEEVTGPSKKTQKRKDQRKKAQQRHDERLLEQGLERGRREEAERQEAERREAAARAGQLTITEMDENADGEDSRSPILPAEVKEME
jgi:hypothetical protein